MFALGQNIEGIFGQRLRIFNGIVWLVVGGGLTGLLGAGVFFRSSYFYLLKFLLKREYSFESDGIVYFIKVLGGNYILWKKKVELLSILPSILSITSKC